MRDRFDAIVIGAGPAGSSAAILLASAGWRVALVEKQRFPRRKVCGECIAASNLPLLDALGVGTAFHAAAGPALRRVGLMRGDAEVVADLPAADHSRHRYGRALGRETLDTLLLERADETGATVLQPCSVEAVDGHAGAWRCTLRRLDGRAGPGALPILGAPVLIAAHGSWEPLPSDRLKARRVRRPSDLFAFKATFRGAALPEGLLPVLCFDGGYGGMVIGDGGLMTLACCVRADRLHALRTAGPGLSAGAAVEAMLRSQCRGVREALAGATQEGAWLAAGPIDPGIRLRADDGLLRIGNAAGEAHPIIGEGMSMAFQSAALLCEALVRDAPASVADAAWQRALAREHAERWRQEFSPRLRLAAAFANLAMRPFTAVPLMALASAWPGLLGAGARRGGKLRCAVAV